MSYAPPSSGVSFRDPDGVLSLHEGRVLRHMKPVAAERFAQVLANPVIGRLTQDGKLVGTRALGTTSLPESFAGVAGTVYEHERVPFISHPSEWPPLMLGRAAEFTLELALELLDAGFVLKDATPNNILFRGSSPVLVDLPSITPRFPGAFLWLARQQFETCFLLPLIANIEAGVPIAWSLQDPVAGLSHVRLARMLGAKRWLIPSLVTSVALPAALTNVDVQAGHGKREPQVRNDAQARFILERGLRSLLARTRRLIRKLSQHTSSWGAYTATRHHYQDEDLERKREFVTAALDELRPAWVLDVGANTGEFSALAARTSSVVALDIDEVAAGGIFDRARAASLDILPLVLDFARPTPAFGWRNAESAAFLERCRERFDFVLMLAVIHHLRATNGIPLERAFEVVAGLTRRALLIEFVPPTDPMYVRIARGREDLYADYTAESFEAILKRSFAIKRTMKLANGRVLYLTEKHGHH